MWGLNHGRIFVLEITTKTNTMIQVTTLGASIQDFTFLDQIINTETKRKINKVKGSEKFGISTACFIDGEFTLVSDYGLEVEMIVDLENA